MNSSKMEETNNKTIKTNLEDKQSGNYKHSSSADVEKFELAEDANETNDSHNSANYKEEENEAIAKIETKQQNENPTKDLQAATAEPSTPAQEPIAVRKYYTLLGKFTDDSTKLQNIDLSSHSPIEHATIKHDTMGEFVHPPSASSVSFANLVLNVFPSSPCINRITEDDESDNNSSDENYTEKVIPTAPYEPLLSSDLSETDEVLVRRCGDSCVDETSRDELDELSEVENVDLTSFGKDSLEAMYYRIRKDEILLDKSRKEISAGKLMIKRKNNDAYEEHGVSEQPTEMSNVEDESPKKESKCLENVYEEHGISEQVTSNQEEEDENIDETPKNSEQSVNPVEFAIEQQKILVQKLHTSSVNYEDVVTPLEDQEEDDQYPDSLDIRRKMWASSVSETDSDYVDLSAHRLTRDDFNISTAFDHLSSSESGSTIVSAATKIQAGARGFLARRRIRRSSGGTSATSIDNTCSFGNAAIDKSLEDLIEQQELLTMDEAVVKVQRFYRMYRQRKQRPTATEKQQRLISAHACDDSQCPGGDDGEDDADRGGQSQEQDLVDVINVRFAQKPAASEMPLEKCKSEQSVSPAPHQPKFSDKEIVEQQRLSDQQHQPAALNDVCEPAKIAANDAQRGWSPNNHQQQHQHMSIALSSADDDSFEMDSMVHHQRRRLTLQRGDAVQRYSSSPDESSSSPKSTNNVVQTSAIAKTAFPNTIDGTPTPSPAYALSSSSSSSSQSKCERRNVVCCVYFHIANKKHISHIYYLFLLSHNNKKPKPKQTHRAFQYV